MKPLVIAIAGILALGGGAVAGALLGKGGDHQGEADALMKSARPSTPTTFEYFKFNSQFVIPVQSNGQVSGLIVANLQLELADGTTEQAFRREPRVRDAFLKILFNMAAEGAFLQDIFAPDTQTELRGRLLNAAREIIGDSVNAVLISDFLKQDR